MAVRATSSGVQSLPIGIFRSRSHQPLAPLPISLTLQKPMHQPPTKAGDACGDLQHSLKADITNCNHGSLLGECVANRCTNSAPASRDNRDFSPESHLSCPICGFQFHPAVSTGALMRNQSALICSIPHQRTDRYLSHSLRPLTQER